jgi:hypothetical protein
MKSFKYFIFFSIFFSAIIFLNINLSHADFTASLSGDGVVHLSGSKSFECVPEGFDHGSAAIVTLYMTPGGVSGAIIAIIESGGSTVSFSGIEHNLSCKNPGAYTHRVSFSGGRWYENPPNPPFCQMSGFPPEDSTVDLPDGRGVSIGAPGEQVTGVENINVSYNFTYSTSSCEDNGVDPCRRIVSIQIGTQSVYNQGDLPLSGQISVPYDFSNLTESKVIKASACCGGRCKTTEKVVYKEPDDQGSPNKGSDDQTSPDPKPSGPPAPTACLGVGKPVNLANGNVFKAETDFSLPGILPINFTRYYNSKGTLMRGFGQSWSHSFDTRVIGFGVNVYKVLNPDGSVFYIQ